MKRRSFLTTATSAAIGSTLVSSSIALLANKKEHRSTLRNSPASHFDVIVIGVGSMGSAACWYLAQRGHKVLGLEQFDISHDKGSHSGQSRIIRKAYFEHPDYVPLLERAYANWKTLENQTGSSLYERTGILYLGRPEAEVMKGIRKSASLYKVSIELPSLPQARQQFPGFQIPSDFQAIVEPDSGFVIPEQSILLYASEAIKKGAEIHTNENVVTWKQNGNGVSVTTDKGTYTCDKLILTAGSWTSKMIPGLKTELKVTKQMVAWVNPKNWKPFSLGNFPCWFVEDPERGSYYGFPILPSARFGGPLGLKLAHHSPGEVSDPDHVNRNTTPGTAEDLRYLLTKYIPEADGEILSMKSCLYTYSKDENFIIDHLPGYEKRVTIACGFSGHGFKFVPVVGEILADLSMKGKTDLPIGFLRLGRFQ